MTVGKAERVMCRDQGMGGGGGGAGDDGNGYAGNNKRCGRSGLTT